MTMNKSLKIILSMSCISAMLAFGCKKKEEFEVDNETQSAVDNAVADQEYASIVPTVNNVAINTKGTGAAGRLMAACDTLTKISGDTLFGTTGHVDPTYTLNISNNSGCNVMPDSKIRQGSLSIRLTNKIKVPGAKMIIKMLNYKTGTIGYSCDSIVVTTVAFNQTYTEFNIKLINGICVSPNWTIKYSSDRNIKHYNKGNPVGTDPVTMVWGTANGTNRQGRAFTVNIPAETALVKHKSCAFVDKGKMGLTPEGFKERIVDFGNGTCDDDATFTVNGNTVAFKLK
jgi:hypothetical protein